MNHISAKHFTNTFMSENIYNHLRRSSWGLMPLSSLMTHFMSVEWLSEGLRSLLGLDSCCHPGHFAQSFLLLANYVRCPWTFQWSASFPPRKSPYFAHLLAWLEALRCTDTLIGWIYKIQNEWTKWQSPRKDFGITQTLVVSLSPVHRLNFPPIFEGVCVITKSFSLSFHCVHSFIL